MGQLRVALATFVIGAGVMAVELTASRLLAPYFGASMFVWTSLIVTVLLALSVGYYLGGKSAAKGAGLEIVGYLVCAAAVFLSLGTLIIPSFSHAISGMLVGLSSASIALFLGSLVVTIFVFALPLFMMGVCGPILLKEWSSFGDIGVISGRYFAVSTIGSVLGTVAPTLLLVPWLGARITIFAVAVIFLLLGFSLLSLQRRGIGAAALAIAFMPMAVPYHAPAEVIFERESPYQLLRVSELVDGKRYLIFNEGSGVQSVYAPKGERTGFYYDYMGLVPLLHPKQAGETHRGLIIGLAGGTIAQRYRSFLHNPDFSIDLTGVEVDAAVIDAARRFFDLDATGVRVVNADGRMFLANEARAQGPGYDAIIADAYSTQLYIPPHLATKEFYALVKSRLAENGVFVMNVNAPTIDSRLLVALANTVASEFQYVSVIDVGSSWNHLIVASEQPINMPAVARSIPSEFEDVMVSAQNARQVAFDPAAEVFTDDRAPIEFLTDSMIVGQVLGRAK